MKMVVFSHKACWPSGNSPMGYATDGGFVFHMQAIASLCEQVTLVVPVVKPKPSGEVLFTAANIKVVPLALPEVVGVRRKLAMGWFIIKQLVPFISIIKKHDAVHTPIPSDVGTVGMLIAHIMNKPLLVRHCGNWYKQTTLAEKFWKWYMEKYAGGKRVFLATGGGLQPPSAKNPNIQWIFSSSLSKAQLALNSQRNAINAAPVWHLAIACRQDEKKGTGRAIQALALLPNAAQFRLHIVGDGPDLPAFKQLAQDLGVTDLVSFYGKLSHQKVLEVLKRADLFVYPTDASEGFPKVVLEAMSCGLPVITTQVSLLPMLIEGHNAGVILKHNNAEHLAQAINQACAQPEQLRQWSANAVACAHQFSLEAWAQFIKSAITPAWLPYLPAGRSSVSI